MVPKGISLRRTEEFLKGLPEVVDAQVGYDEHGMTAQVVVSGREHVTAKGLQSECLHQLGLHQTPRNVLLTWALPLAA